MTDGRTATTVTTDVTRGRRRVDGVARAPTRRERRSLPGCLAVLVALALVVGGFYFGVTKGVDVRQRPVRRARGLPGPGHAAR